MTETPKSKAEIAADELHDTVKSLILRLAAADGYLHATQESDNPDVRDAGATTYIAEVAFGLAVEGLTLSALLQEVREALSESEKPAEPKLPTFIQPLGEAS